MKHMTSMKHMLLSLCLLFGLSSAARAQSDEEQIRRTLWTFIDGTVYNYPDSIAGAFYPNTRMFLFHESDTVWTMTGEEYAALYTRRPPGTRNARYGSIVSLDIVGEAAYAKVKIRIPGFGRDYYDLLLLKKFAEGWKITGKVTWAEPIPKMPQEQMAQPTKEVVMEGLKRPWSMAFLSETEALVAEKDGDLLRVNLSTGERKAIAGLPEDVGRPILIDTTQHAQGVFPGPAHGQRHAFNAGWFQVLLDPKFEVNHLIYLSYAAVNEEQAHATKVIRGVLAGDKLTQVETIFLAAPYSHGLFHFGGGMVFGPEGKLYLATGERNFFEYLNPEIPTAQDVRDPRGKIIRINADGSIPEDNPDFGPEAVPGLYALGIRATQGMVVDPTTGRIWFSEHGTMQGDELNLLHAGANYGWPNRTSGGYRTSDYQPKDLPGAVYTDPAHFWEVTVAPTGLAFYKGNEFAQWDGDLLVPGLSKGNLWRMKTDGDQVTGAEELFINDRIRLRKVVTSPLGKIYLLTDEENGRIIRLVNANQ